MCLTYLTLIYDLETKIDSSVCSTKGVLTLLEILEIYKVSLKVSGWVCAFVVNMTENSCISQCISRKHLMLHASLFKLFIVSTKNCNLYWIFVKMSPGNLLEIIPADLLDALSTELCKSDICCLKKQLIIRQWVTSLFELVFRWVFSLSPKTNLTPEFWSQSEVRISWTETGAKIATKIPVLLIFVWLTRYSFYLLFCTSLSIALKLVLHKKWRNR